MYVEIFEKKKKVNSIARLPVWLLYLWVHEKKNIIHAPLGLNYVFTYNKHCTVPETLTLA